MPLKLSFVLMCLEAACLGWTLVVERGTLAPFEASHPQGGLELKHSFKELLSFSPKVQRTGEGELVSFLCLCFEALEGVLNVCTRVFSRDAGMFIFQLDFFSLEKELLITDHLFKNSAKISPFSVLFDSLHC